MKVTKTDTGVRLDLTHAEARVVRQVDTLLWRVEESLGDEDELPQIRTAQSVFAELDDELGTAGIRYRSLLVSPYDEDPS